MTDKLDKTPLGDFLGHDPQPFRFNRAALESYSQNKITSLQSRFKSAQESGDDAAMEAARNSLTRIKQDHKAMMDAADFWKTGDVAWAGFETGKKDGDDVLTAFVVIPHEENGGGGWEKRMSVPISMFLASMENVHPINIEHTKTLGGKTTKTYNTVGLEFRDSYGSSSFRWKITPFSKPEEVGKVVRMFNINRTIQPQAKGTMNGNTFEK